MSNKLFTLLLASIGFAFVAPSNAIAQRSLERTADQYREVVKDFEREVFRSRIMGREQRRLADDLEDQTSRIRSAVRDRNRSYRALEEIDRAALIQTQIEAYVFANPACPSRGVLFPLWQRVIATHAALSAQARAVLGGGIGFQPGIPGSGIGGGIGLGTGGFIDAAPGYGSFRPDFDNRIGSTWNRPRYGSYYGSDLYGYGRSGGYGAGGYGVDYGRPVIQTRVYRYPVDDNCGPTGLDIGRAVIGALLQR